MAGVRGVNGLQVYSVRCACGGDEGEMAHDMRGHMPVWRSCA